jgi:Fungal specific transcription factor domain
MKLGPLTTEMRKRVFWSQYVLDTFSSAIVGLPKLLDDAQIDTEFPADLYSLFLTILMTGMMIT